MSTAHNVLARERMYSFADHNPYLPSSTDAALVEDNLTRFRDGALDLRNFLRQTPCFPHWKEEHIASSRVLLVMNEQSLGWADRLYPDLGLAESAEDVARMFHEVVLSFLAMTNHALLCGICGEYPWGEGGTWEFKYPQLSSCGKAGYFLKQEEIENFQGQKVLHLPLSPFAQDGPHVPNPRNDQAREYHQENLDVIRRFCEYATDDAPRHVFVLGNRARIRCSNGSCFLESCLTPDKDKSRKVIDFLRVVDSRAAPVSVRICRYIPRHGTDPEVFVAVSTASYELRRL